MDEFMEDNLLENITSAKFHFVDLAGSERANRTGNTGERFFSILYLPYILNFIYFFKNVPWFITLDKAKLKAI